ncbi:MAG TPA: beta/gamma crystallin-related protein [Usitatibacter sp.]|nr:beta/gamma crystallin-related protein [Usitatibacter sp.]
MKRTILAAALVGLFAGTSQAAVTEFIIYKQPNFRGASQVVKGEIANLEGGFAREGSSLVVKGGYWEVCSNDHFKGRCRVIEPGEYPSLPRHWEDRIVSVRFVGTDSKIAQRVAKEDRREARAEWREERREARQEAREDRREERRAYRYAGSIELFNRPAFRGRAVTIDDNVRDLGNGRFDGKASSAIVHDGTWQVCTEPGYAGRCEVLRPGRYAELAYLDDRISSIRQIR